MNIDRKIVEQALEAFEIVFDCRPIGYATLTEAREHKLRNAATALRAALDQPAPSVEPVAWMTHESLHRLKKGGNSKGAVPVHKVRSHTAKIPVHITLPVKAVENTDG